MAKGKKERLGKKTFYAMRERIVDLRKEDKLISFSL